MIMAEAPLINMRHREPRPVGLFSPKSFLSLSPPPLHPSFSLWEDAHLRDDEMSFAPSPMTPCLPKNDMSPACVSSLPESPKGPPSNLTGTLIATVPGPFRGKKAS